MRLKSLLVAITCSLLTACNQASGYEYQNVRADSLNYSPDVTKIALRQLGKPYKYGGNGPYHFDCSGLVYYSFSRVGIDVPRSASEQLDHAVRIPVSKLQSGDLVFFRITQNKISHVGIYIGGNRFIHSPSAGKHVQIVKLNNPYWRSRFVAAARIPNR